jgi:prophage regulatory protein
MKDLSTNNTVSTIYRLEQIKHLSQLSKSSIYLYIKRGEFPAPIKLGRRAVGWRSSDIEAWVASLSSKQSSNLKNQGVGK